MHLGKINAITAFLLVCGLLSFSCGKEEKSSGEKSEEEQSAISLAPTGSSAGHYYVDLGLSVKWACYNLGAEDPLEVGDYYAWGDITPHTEWTSVNYNFTYAPCSEDYTLDTQFDAVTASWGNTWRMPTTKEINELLDRSKCKWIWIENANGDNVSGYCVQSLINGNAIFLPAGHTRLSKKTGYYWSATTDAVVVKHPSQHSPQTIFFQEGIHYLGEAKCTEGICIRGVVGEPNSYFQKKEEYETINTSETSKQGFTVSGKVGSHTYVNLGLPSRTLWATYNVGASLPHGYGEYYAWGETAPKALYTQDTYKYFIGNSETGPYHWAQYSKYVWYAQHGKPDYLLTLQPGDDAATVNFGTNWQMPSIEQIEELAYYCQWYRKDITVNGKKIVGYVGESKINGYKIYLPCQDCKYSNQPVTYLDTWYWSRDLSTAESSSDATDYWAFYMTFDTSGYTPLLVAMDTQRVRGLPIRAVVKK